jgi:hypothetical protein
MLDCSSRQLQTVDFRFINGSVCDLAMERDVDLRWPRRSPEQKYREFLDELGAEIDRRHPGVFEWRFGKPSQNVVDGLIITKADVGGYVFVVGSCQWSGGVQGGVWRDGARHSYSASIMEKREWEVSNLSHWQVRYLESRCSEEVGDIVDWIVKDWAFERPWRAPSPIDPIVEKKRLQRIAGGLKSRSDVSVIVEAEVGPGHKLTPEGEAALRDDLAGLLPSRIRDGFPPDKRGALALKITVLLACYETTSPPGRDRKLCLAALGPQRRSDRQETRVKLEALIPANQDHCWQHERWRWHADSADTNLAIQWGCPVPVGALAAGVLSAAQLSEKFSNGSAEAADKAALAILLQDEGRLIEALELYGVEIDGDLKRLCGGQKIYPPACCAYADENWVQQFQGWMRACAPWLLGNATRREAERIAVWAAEKKSRRRRLPVLKLLVFPGQHHSRKASLILTSADLEGTRPRLEIQATASNARLHESAWKRPLEIDLARYSL